MKVWPRFCCSTQLSTAVGMVTDALTRSVQAADDSRQEVVVEARTKDGKESNHALDESRRAEAGKWCAGATTRFRGATVPRLLLVCFFFVLLSDSSSRIAMAQQCSSDTDCDPGFACFSGVCRQTCTIDSDCSDGLFCPFGICQRCHVSSQCDDGLFCNGIEACLPNDPGAEANGCVSTSSPCPLAEQCDEGFDVCLAECDDVDGDGALSPACGGSDCDDTDPGRYPGNAEVCDPENLDEDCDVTTFGSRDTDGDSFIDGNCCNQQLDGTLLCGTDCDDFRAGVHPASPEVCNTIDDNCDGIIDIDQVSLLERGFVDVDRDGFGDVAMPVDVCPFDLGDLARLPGDCSTLDPRVHPGAPEICNGIDDDCDGAVDEGLPAGCLQ